MIQKIFHVTWIIFGVAFITALAFIVLMLWQIGCVIDDIQNTVSDLTREDVTRLLNVLEQQVENDKMKYTARLAEFPPDFLGELGWLPSPRSIRIHFIDGEGWFVYWGSGNYTLMQRIEPWFEKKFGGDWEITID